MLLEFFKSILTLPLIMGIAYIYYIYPLTLLIKFFRGILGVK